MSDLERITTGDFIGFSHPRVIIDTNERLIQVTSAVTKWHEDMRTVCGFRSKEKILTCKTFRYWQSEALRIGYKIDVSDTNAILINPV